MKQYTAVNVHEKAQHMDAPLEKKGTHTFNHSSEQIYRSHKCVHVLKSLTDTYQSQLLRAQSHLLLIEEIIGGF